MKQTKLNTLWMQKLCLICRISRFRPRNAWNLWHKSTIFDLKKVSKDMYIHNCPSIVVTPFQQTSYHWIYIAFFQYYLSDHVNLPKFCLNYEQDMKVYGSFESDNGLDISGIRFKTRIYSFSVKFDLLCS